MVLSELRSAFERLPGPLPNYNLLHAILLMLALEEGPCGRKRISSIISLGEGSARSLINKLRDLKWIDCGKEGCFLTPLGREKIEELRRCLLGPMKVSLMELFRGDVYLTLVRCVNYLDILDLRDEAVRFGGKGALIFAVRGKRVIFPETGEDLSIYAPNDSKILESLGASDGDLIIIGLSEDPQISKLSSLGASLLAIQGPRK
jgi:predicted transcriptional regulator